MKRRGVLLVVALFAVASLMGAMAYNTAQVNSPAALSVVATDQALLSLCPLGGLGNLDQTAEVQEDGRLLFQFGRGNNPWFGGDKMYGLQPGSTYTWWQGGASNTGLFSIRNKSAETIKLGIKAENVPQGVHVYVNQSMGDGGNGTQDITNQRAELPRVLGSGNSCDIGVQIVVDDNAALGASSGMKIIVDSTAVSTGGSPQV